MINITGYLVKPYDVVLVFVGVDEICWWLLHELKEGGAGRESHLTPGNA
jgi:protein-L-isoaspartate O-methyltransferase